MFQKYQIVRGKLIAHSVGSTDKSFPVTRNALRRDSDSLISSPIWKLRHQAIAVMICVLTATVSQASLIGDTITIQGNSPNQIYLNQTLTREVTADASDAVVLEFSNIDRLRIDPFDSGFAIDYLAPFPSDYGVGTFLEFSDLQWQDVPGEIVGVSVDHDTALSFSTSFTPDSVRVNFNGRFGIDEEFTVHLETRHNAGELIPEPSTFVTWLGLGLIVSGGYRLRRRSPNEADQS